MSPKFLLFLMVVAVTATVATADIFGDLLGWDFVGALTGESQEKKATKTQREDEESGSTCDCAGQTCNCCVDFNLTSIIDLGGPGCVKMRYISQKEGVSLNVSYGDSLLHSQTVKQNDKKGSCMDLLSELAQICAKFAHLKETDDGLEGCLHFEPHVLGEVTAKYHIGCFKMGPEGMQQDQKLAEAEEVPEEKPSTEEGDKQDEEEDDADDSSSILDVVNHSAAQGISFISDLLGIKVPGKKVKNTTAKPEDEPAASAEEEEEEPQEDSRNFKPAKSGLGRMHYHTNDVK